MKVLRNTLLCAFVVLAGCMIFVAAQGKQKVSTTACTDGHVTSNERLRGNRLWSR